MEYEFRQLEAIIRSAAGYVVIYEVKAGSIRPVLYTENVPSFSGLTEDEYLALYGTNASAVVPEADMTMLSGKLEKLFAGEGDQEAVYRTYHKTRGFVWTHVYFKLLGTCGGRPVFIGNFVDASETATASNMLLNHSNQKIYVIERDTYDLLYANAVSQKNRVMFLSGERSVMEKLYVNSKKLKAIQTIVDGMNSEGVPATDQQRKEAEVQLDKAIQALFSTIRETFVTLYYPTKNGIVSADFKLEFKENKFDGEQQIISLLQSEMKYEPFSKEDAFMETLRKKCEARLFTTKEMPYSQICDRAATEISWQWYHPDQLDSLKADCLKKDKWREINGYLVKGPFEKDPTSVSVNQTNYDDKTQEFTLHIKGVGGRVYYDIGADPTAASTEITDSVFVTKEPSLRFICIDPSGERKTGHVFEFTGVAPIKYGQRATSNGQVLTLQTNDNYEVRYTTDGSEPKENGGIYNGEFVVPKGCKFIRTVTLFKGQVIESKDIPVDTTHANPSAKKIDPSKTLIYRMKAKKQLGDTESSYRELEQLSKIDGLFIKGGSAYIYQKDKEENYVEYNANIHYTPTDLMALIDLIRSTSFKNRDVVVTFEYKELLFNAGEKFNTWVDLCKLDLDKLRAEGEIIQ